MPVHQVIYFVWPNVYVYVSAAYYNRTFGEVQLSSYKVGRVDLPIQALRWLTYFKTVNAAILKDVSVGFSQIRSHTKLLYAVIFYTHLNLNVAAYFIIIQAQGQHLHYR